MNTEILELLHRNNQPRDWQKMEPTMRPKRAGSVGTEPVYEFYHTLDDSLEESLQSIAISVQPVNSYIPFHKHNYVEIMIPLLGDCTVVTKREKLHAAQDDIIVMGNNAVHRVEPISTGAIVVNLALKQSAFTMNDFDFMLAESATPSVATMLFSLLSNENHGEANYGLFKIQHDPKIVDTLYDVIQEYYHADNQTSQIIRLEILTLFLRLIRVAGTTKVEVAAHRTTDLLALLLYIEKHYADITLRDMAAYFGFNPNYLSSYLKRATGLTFIKLVHLQRVNVAAKYLTYSSAPIEQIAVKVGYENPSYFYKVFRQHLNVSPTEYREQK
ncbi:AraC family transcriptional regulator [Lactiplantibacillus modestisalitolerans]|uniref:AraC family transcriptional regulator n=1 Tax=Lactiplantibacillus modestisalitolerans TaxID=1457219 RepID=A0ABV5WSY0_9LACO|nr:AraC family transcriptional regulator [Lactiplantibacillus modestisalitolerans]